MLKLDKQKLCPFKLKKHKLCMLNLNKLKLFMLELNQHKLCMPKLYKKTKNAQNYVFQVSPVQPWLWNGIRKITPQ